MRRSLANGAALCLLAHLLAGVAGAAPPDAVVMIRSHGGSVTIIATQPGRSYILSCGHLFEDERGRPSTALRAKPLVIDAPTDRPQGGTIPVKVKVLRVDHQLDLSLIELDDGPLPFVAPVAPAGWQASRSLLAVGYDRMQQPAVEAPCTRLGEGGAMTYTVERPIPGRSGGALLDRGYLVGVCHGYEVLPRGRGMYVSHQAILSFLQRGESPAPAGIDVAPFALPPVLQGCPNGHCPGSH